MGSDNKQGQYVTTAPVPVRFTSQFATTSSLQLRHVADAAQINSGDCSIGHLSRSQRSVRNRNRDRSRVRSLMTITDGVGESVRTRIIVLGHISDRCPIIYDL